MFNRSIPALEALAAWFAIRKLVDVTSGTFLALFAVNAFLARALAHLIALVRHRPFQIACAH